MEVFKAFPKDRIQQRFVEQITSTIQLLTFVEEVLVEVFKAFPKDRIQQRFVEQITSTIQLLTFVEEVLMEVFKASPRDRAPQWFVEQISSFLQLLTLVEEVLVEFFTASPRDRAPQRFVNQSMSTFQFLPLVELGDGVFSAPSAGAADEGPAVRGSGMGQARFASEDAPRGSSSRGQAGSTGEDAPRGSSSCGQAGSTGEDAPRDLSSRGMAVSDRDYLHSILAARGEAVFFESCEFFIWFDGKWQPEGRGSAKLVQHSSGAQYFEFWQNEQIWYDDDIRDVLKPVGRSGRAWWWMDPDFVGGPSDYRHAVRFSSPELARRFYVAWMGSG